MSQINQRLVYNNARRAIARAGANPASAILSQSFLRLEVVASTNKTNYQWGVLVNDAPQGQAPRITETRLNLQDAFYVSEVQFLLGLATDATSTDFPLYSFPNPAQFTTSGAATALNNVYNGSLSLTVNNRVITPGWDMLRHFQANQTQFTAATNSPQNQFNGQSDSAYATEPNWVLIGSKNSQLQLSLPSAISTLQASKTTVLTLILRGVLAQNVTVVS